MSCLILGAAGFIGTNLVKELLKEAAAELILFDKNEADFSDITSESYPGSYKVVTGSFGMDYDFETLTNGIETVYHLISTTIPSNSNNHIAKGIIDNVVVTDKLLGACVRNKVKKIIFLSSGGTVYGIEKSIPFCEDTGTNPISAYGLQKITIEKLLYLYHYMYGLDYRIIRLANPYGRYQKPNGVQGVVTTFAYKALVGEPLTVYGDGEIVRDFIYIEDAVNAIIHVAAYEGDYKIFNVGSGKGYSVNQVIKIIERIREEKVTVHYLEGRTVDVPVNILDLSRYEECIGPMQAVSLEKGIELTMDYLAENI